MPGRLAALLLAALSLGLSGAAPGAAPRVESFSPEGLAKAVRQVAVRFSAPMVAFGDPRPRVDLFQIACPQRGVARWADERSWVYDFAQDLPAGVRCRFTLAPDLRSLAGTPVGGRREFAFSTGGPAIASTIPWDGAAVAEDQRFVLRLDAVPDEASVLAHAWIEVEGLADPLSLRVVTGPERDQSLRARLRDAKPSDLLIEARQRFPAGKRLALVWGRGIATASGIATTETQRIEFRTRDALALQISCPRENARADCLPLGSIELRFSAPVEAAAAARIRLLPVAAPRAEAPRSAVRANDYEGGDHAQGWHIRGPFAPNGRYRLDLPAELRDDAGRSLAPLDASMLEIRVAPLPPLAKFASRIGVVEAATPILPVTLRSIEPEALPTGASIQLAGEAAGLAAPSAAQALALLRAVSGQDWRSRGTSIFARASLAPVPGERRRFELPRTESRDATEVVGIPLPGTGLHVVEIASRALGLSHLDADTPMFASALALVTNLSVHFKWGREGSLAWVTSLDSGTPVAGATVSVFDCHARALATGTSDADGLVRVDGLPAPDADDDCDGYSAYDSGLLVMARREGDVSFVHTSWERGIEPFRFDVPMRWQPVPALAHTIFDRTLVRAGETVHMKHVLRRPVLRGFAQEPIEKRPSVLRILHVGSEQPVELPVAFDALGIAQTDWAIPQSARLGVYQVRLVRPAGSKDEAELELASGSFRVEEFRVPLLAGALQPPTAPVVNAAEFPLDVTLRYLAGGPARGLEATLRTQLRARFVAAPEAYEGFAFLAGSVREGIQRSSLGGEEEKPPAAPDVLTQTLTLDAAGSARARVDGLPISESPRQVVAELAFRDPNGETQTLSSTVPLWPSERMIGLRVAPVLESGEPLRVDTVVLDLAKRPRWRAPVKIELFERKTYSHRKRLVGGFYAYEHVTETRRVGTLCEGRTDWGGRFGCEALPSATGDLIVRASTRDREGRVAATHAERWLGGEDDFWFASESSDRMDLVPERQRYEPGETAVLQVRMPFREASALVTVEREGVAEAFVTRLSGRKPYVKLELRGEHAPNVFVSVLAVRGRVGEPQPTALVDLARPAVKLGMTKLRVGWRAHELTVAVEPERETWRVRDTAKVRVRVRTPGGGLPPPGSELAIAAVDEGLLELAPNTSWRLLEAMEDERSQEVRTSTAQLQVVGRRHFGQKAVASGGGGGGRPTRELFDTLLLWKPRVPLDENGEAALEIPLNDSLTSFRVVAVANGGDDRFGTGSAAIRTTQELMLLPGVPPLAREGDRLRPEFTLRNTSDAALAIEASLRVEGLAHALLPQQLTLAPGEARALGFEVEVPAGVSELVYELRARSDKGFEDRVRVVERVVPAVPERVFQAALLRLDRPLSLPVERPRDALPERGAVSVSLLASLGNGSDGIRTFFGQYPFRCLEQDTSKAIGLRDLSLWNAIALQLPAYLDGDGLAKFFPSMARGSEVLTSYLLAVTQEAGWEIPKPSRDAMLAGLEAFVDGRITRSSWSPVADLPLRKLAALDALARHGRDVSARLTAVPRQPELWPTSALLDYLSLLRRLPPNAERRTQIERSERLLRARLTLGGTTLGFSTERADLMDWMLATPETNLNRFVLLAHESPGFRSDLPRLMKGALGRQRRGAWSTTIANAWGRLALERFAKEFEATPVAGETDVSLAATRHRVDWSSPEAAARLRLPWPPGRSDVTLRHRGSGAPWAEVLSIAAIPLRAPLFAGYTLERRLEAIEQRVPGRWSRGDLVRVHVAVEAQSDAAWVVISDPIPTGASILGSGLGRDSALASQGEKDEGDGWWCPCRAFTERSFEAYRDYFEYVPKGPVRIEYTMRLNQDGRFELPPTRVEAMYAPESFAELPHETIEVAP
jgi:hypothetical protein